MGPQVVGRSADAPIVRRNSGAIEARHAAYRWGSAAPATHHLGLCQGWRMERVWIFDKLAVAVMRIDFVDPAVADLPAARERGVRVEVRAADAATAGSVYVSPAISLRPAVCRLDLLESRPGACDRMHWHPDMTGGEPGERVFDESMRADPVGWVAARLRAVGELLPPELRDDDGYEPAAAAIANEADEIAAVVRDGLVWARRPWPDVDHDERGMALPQ
jgi:hypothetical protein